MPNAIVSIAGAVTLGATLMFGLSQPVTSPVERSAALDTAINADMVSTWLLRNGSTGEICTLEKSARVSLNSFKVIADGDCHHILNNQQELTTWQQDDHGNIALTDHRGIAVLEFSALNDFGIASTQFGSMPIVLSPAG